MGRWRWFSLENRRASPDLSAAGGLRRRLLGRADAPGIGRKGRLREGRGVRLGAGPPRDEEAGRDGLEHRAGRRPAGGVGGGVRLRRQGGERPGVAGDDLSGRLHFEAFHGDRRHAARRTGNDGHRPAPGRLSPRVLDPHPFRRCRSRHPPLHHDPPLGPSFRLPEGDVDAGSRIVHPDGRPRKGRIRGESARRRIFLLQPGGDPSRGRDREGGRPRLRLPRRGRAPSPAGDDPLLLFHIGRPVAPCGERVPEREGGGGSAAARRSRRGAEHQRARPEPFRPDGARGREGRRPSNHHAGYACRNAPPAERGSPPRPGFPRGAGLDARGAGGHRPPRQRPGGVPRRRHSPVPRPDDRSAGTVAGGRGPGELRHVGTGREESGDGSAEARPRGENRSPAAGTGKDRERARAPFRRRRCDGTRVGTPRWPAR